MESGIKAMQRRMDSAKERSNTEFGRHLRFFRWDDGERKVVRFLSDGDDLITANQYSGIICADGKIRSFIVDPAKGDWVATYRRDPIGMTQDFKTKQPEEPRLREISAAVAVLRDERPAKSGKGLETFDHEEEIDVDGTKTRARLFGIIEQSHYYDFWYTIAGMHERYGSLLDRDFQITKSGKGLNTKWSIIPCDPIEGFREPEVVREHYGYGHPRASDDPERYLYCPETVGQWADRITSEDYVKHWLLGASSSGEAPASTASKPVAVAASLGGGGNVASGNSVAAEELASLRDRLLAHEGGGDEAQASSDEPDF